MADQVQVAVSMVTMMSDRLTSELARSKAAKLLKRRGSGSSLLSENTSSSRYKQTESVSTVSYMDDPSDPSRLGADVSLEPTYQMEPRRHFPVGKVEDILQEVLKHYLDEERYEPDLCKQMVKTISDVVNARVKDLQLARYKIISIVHIGQRSDHGFKISSRCLWDAQQDNSSSQVFRNASLFAVAMVYGIYHE